MRIAPSTAAAPTAPTAPTGPGAPSPTPAQAFVQQAGWLLAPGSIVVGLKPIDATSVLVLVEDQLAADPKDHIEADHLAADSALTVLEQAAHGVRLIPTTRLGYVGQLRQLAPAQLTFATGLPGVQRYDLVPTDLDGDGHIAPEEVAHQIEVDSPADVARIDWLLRDSFNEGSVQRGPVHIIVPTRPWRAARAPVA